MLNYNYILLKYKVLQKLNRTVNKKNPKFSKITVSAASSRNHTMKPDFRHTGTSYSLPKVYITCNNKNTESKISIFYIFNENSPFDTKMQH